MRSRDESNINLKRAVVGRALPCRSCGYNLRGLRMEARCPECGLEVKTTINEVIDSSRLDFPAISNPRAVGNALLWVAGCSLLCGALIVMPAAGGALQGLEQWRAGRWTGLESRELYLAAALVALFGLRGAWVIARSDRRSGEARPRRLGAMIAAGFVMVASSALVAWAIEQSVDAVGVSQGAADRLWPRFGLACGGGILFLGLGSVLDSVGQRSRMYREARGGKQSTRLMAAALAIIAIATSLHIVANDQRQPRLQWVGEVTALSCAVMVLVGCVYLVVNAWWVRRALTRPAPRLRDIVRIEPDTTRLAASSQSSGSHGGGRRRE